MTAADQRVAQGVADLREQLDVLGQADPADVRRFLDLVESTLARTAELPAAAPTYLPVPPGDGMPLGGRSTWGADEGEGATVLSMRGRLRSDTPGCGRRGGRLGLLCTETLAHGGDHVARGEDGRVIDRWSAERPGGAT